MEASGQFGLDLRPGEITAGQVLERIRRESRDEAEKGRWFENLVSRVLRDQKEYEVTEVHRWADCHSFRNANRLHRSQFMDQRITRPARRPINSVEQAWSAECPFRTFGKQPE